jgi:hypothetical protein
MTGTASSARRFLHAQRDGTTRDGTTRDEHVATRWLLRQLTKPGTLPSACSGLPKLVSS